MPVQPEALTTPQAPISGRIAVVDVLRAVALFGIVVTHAGMGFLAGRPPRPDFMAFTPLDQGVGQIVMLFFNGKFFTIFSFLFGLSFAIQLNNAAQKGKAFSGRFAWRLILLAAIGLAHGAYFSGDILIIYALLGLLLIPVQTMNTKVLAAVAVVLLLNMPGLLMGLSRAGSSPPPPPPATSQPSAGPAPSSPQRQFDIKQRGTVGELVHLNLTESLQAKWVFQVRTGRLWMTYGLFLLGLCAGRMQLFRDSEANRKFFRRLLIGAGVVAAGTTIVAVLKPVTPMATDTLGVLAGFSFSVQQASLSAVYLASITLWFWRQPASGLLPQLAPMGKMGLTTYLLQSVSGLALFYGIGFGMLGHLGIAASVIAGMAIFAVQILLSRWWMSRFSMGPVEWLWRSLTFLRWQPNSRVALVAS
jgi:uncharacterized protein